MPMQQQNAGFAQGLGGRLAAANAACADKPIDTGMRRLPPGIRDGVARLSACYTKQYEDDKQGLKGKTFFRASAVVVYPTEHGGMKVAGMVTSQVIPLCDVPAREGSQKKAVSFEENWDAFQNLMKILGVNPPREQGSDEAAGIRIQQYYLAAMQALVDPARVKTNPVYIRFSTRGWTPPTAPGQPKAEEMVFETWHEQVKWDGRPDPAAGVVTSQPPPRSMPPGTNGVPAAPAAPSTLPPQMPTLSPTAIAGEVQDVVASLVEIAMNDPEGATEDGADASARLEEMAIALGWTQEQTGAAPDWAAVGDMALNPPPQAAPATQPATQGATPTPTVGSRWMFAKRTREGAKLKNARGEEFPPQEVEVAYVDLASQTCTVRTTRDGKDVVDIKTKQPVAVKFEWLERVPF